LNFSKAGCVATLFICNLVAYKPSCVFYCYKCCSKSHKCCGLAMVSIQSSYTFASKCKCFSPFGNLVSCSLLTSWFYSFNCFSCGDVICGTSYLCSLNCVSYGVVICGNSIVCLATCTTLTLPLPLLALYMVPLCPSSFFVPSNLCSTVPSSLLNLRFLLLQLCSSF
jgi:hypothetical protein